MIVKKFMNTEKRPNFENICENIEHNYYQMIDMTKNEKQKIKSFIDEYKKKLQVICIMINHLKKSL